MKIVELDGNTLNPGDLSWSDFENFGKVKVFSPTPVDLVAERAKDANSLLTNKTPIKCV